MMDCKINIIKRLSRELRIYNKILYYNLPTCRKRVHLYGNYKCKVIE